MKLWTLNLAFRRSTKIAKYIVSRCNLFQYLFFESWIFWTLKHFELFFQSMTYFICLIQTYTLGKTRNSKSCFSKKHKKSKLRRFYVLKYFKRGLFECIFSTSETFWNFSFLFLKRCIGLSSNSDALYKIWTKKLALRNFLNPNMTPCNIFDSKRCFLKCGENAKNVTFME